MFCKTCRFLVIMVLTLTQGLALADGSAPAKALEGIVQETLKNNEDLKAAEARWQMIERKIVPAGSLDDPMLSLGFLNYPIDSFKDDETPMTGKDIRISQKFPFPGKLAAKTEMAEQQALWYKGVYEDGKLQVIRKVKDAYYRLFYIDKAIEITEKNIDLLEDFIRLTETRYEVGSGLQQDVLKAQVERSKLMDKLFTFRQQQQSALADLNTLRSLPSVTPIEAPAELELTAINRELEQLQKGSEKNRPLYAAYASLIERFKSQRRLAKLNYRPDFTLWAGYRLREDSGMDPVDGEDFVSAGVSLNLPIYRSKRNEAVAEADSGLSMAHRQYRDFQNKVHFAIHDAFSQVEKNRDQALLFRTGIIPQAQQAFQASMSAYQVGRVDFLTLLDALLTLYRFEMDYYRVVTDHERSVARLEAEAGLNLDVIENSGSDVTSH